MNMNQYFFISFIFFVNKIDYMYVEGGRDVAETVYICTLELLTRQKIMPS